MTDFDIQEQLNSLHGKLDLLLEEVAIQRSRQRETEDLIADLQHVAKEAYQAFVVRLDQEGIELSGENVSQLGMNLLKNLGSFNEILGTLRSVKDFMSDAGPIIQHLGVQFIHKMAEFDNKGYFEYLNQMGNLAETLVHNFTAQDLARLNKNLPVIINILKNITSEQNLRFIEKAVEISKIMKIDDTLDNKSLFGIYKELKSPEIRKSISFGLRLVKELDRSRKQGSSLPEQVNI